MKKAVLITICTVMILSGMSLVPNVFSQDNAIPEWVKNNAGWWADDQLDDTSFVSSIQWLISNDVMIIPYTEQVMGNSNNIIPEWVKNNAGWWANGEISEGEFVNAIQFLIRNNVIVISNSSNDDRLCIDNQLSTKFKEKMQADLKEEWNSLCSNFYDEKYLEWSPLGQLSCSEYKDSAFCVNAKPITPSEIPTVNLNNLGFRCVSNLDESNNGAWCSDITKEKPDNTYRIFLMGGSTMFGIGSTSDNTTIPGYLQKIFDEGNYGFDIEVINSGISSAWSKNEVALIKNKIIDMNPDLILVYDGFNDISYSKVRPGYTEGSEIEWKDRWSEICSLGKKNGFKTVVTLQAFNGSGFRALTENDIEIFTQEGFLNRDISQLYSNQIQDLSENCEASIDMTYVLDRIHEGDLFIDPVHTIDKANEIIADRFYQIVLPIIEEDEYSESSKLNMDSKAVINYLLSVKNLDFTNANFENMELSGINFSGRNLENAVFYNADLDNAFFTNANLKGVNFGGASLKGVDFVGADLTGAKLIKTPIDGADFTNAKLDKTQLFEVDFTDTDISNTSVRQAKILDVNFKGVDLSGTDFSESEFLITATIITGSDLQQMDAETLERTMKQGGYFRMYSSVDFTAANLSGVNLTNAILRGVNLTDADLTNAIILETDFTNAKLDCSNNSICN